jgi:hypothetical protein
VLAGILWAALGWAAEGSPAADLQGLSKHVDSAMVALKSGDVREARRRYQDFDRGWDRIEDGVRAKSREVYQKVERAMGGVKNKLVKPSKPDADAALKALGELKSTIEASLSALR